MGWLDKIFGKDEAAAPQDTSAPSIVNRAAPFAGLEGIRFGRYSDNNKSYSKTRSRQLAEERFKEKAYPEAFAAFFDYILDEAEQNVVFRPDGDSFTFEFIQGSKKVYGKSDGKRITAKVSIAVMEQPSNAVMRRLLELNFSLCYSHCALDDQQTLCMLFDSEVHRASPGKLYSGLREMAKYADRQDDLLVADFESLRPIDIGHIQLLPAAELDVKYHYFQKWIGDTLSRTDALNPDSFSGAISYAFLTLLYRIDFLIVPEARLLARLQEVGDMYWNKKDEITIVERNARIKAGIRELSRVTRNDFADGLYRSRSTFAVSPLPPADKIREHIQGANRDSQWYIENKHVDLALLINEYGMVYNQFLYAMPAVLTELITIYMAVLHADYFRDLGMRQLFYEPGAGTFNTDAIIEAIDRVLSRWSENYVALNWDHRRISYNSLWDFAYSFSEHVATLNIEARR